ncbi:MAG: DUF3108 domain-containing protein [Acidobacteriia bacterium]|nr:DUF3108 domain-containing protein [Terriglobia bacterium]
MSIKRKDVCFVGVDRPRRMRRVVGGLLWAGSLALVLVLACFLHPPAPTPLLAQTSQTQAAPVPAASQTLNYNIYWRTASAGVATIRLERDPKANQIKISGDAHSSRFVSTLYRVEDQFESLVSLKEFCTLKINKQTNEGRRHREMLVDFFPDQRVARWQDRNTAVPSSPVRHSQTSIPGCVHDVFSAAFYLQTQRLELGKTIQFPIFDGGKTYTVAVEVQQRETVKTDAGTFQTIRVEPKVFGNLFHRSGRMFVWYTDDAEHHLVQLKARISVGTITASLATPLKPATPAAPSSSSP